MVEKQLISPHVISNNYYRHITMKFTDTERLILANQYEILSELRSDKSYQDLAENLKDGHEWIYNQHIFLSPIFSEEASDFVVDILSLYEALQTSYKNLTDKGDLTEEKVRFPGFDGNNEGSYMRFFKALIKNGQFSHIDARTNSHARTLDRYAKMLKKWKTLNLDNEYELSIDEINHIFAY